MGGTCVVLFCQAELPVLVKAVADTVVGVCQRCSLSVLLRVHVLPELAEGCVVVLLFEVAVPQVIISQCIHVGIALARIVQIGTVVGNGIRILLLSVVRFAAPEVGVATGFRVVGTERDGLVEQVDRLVYLRIGKCLRTKLE